MGKLVRPAQCQADILHGSFEVIWVEWLTARGFHDGSEGEPLACGRGKRRLRAETRHCHASRRILVHVLRCSIWMSAVIRERPWECFAIYHDELAAEVVAGYLRRNDCPAQIAGRAGAALDHPGVRVLVPGGLLHRARWLWAKSDLTEAELQYLATGELPGDSDR